MTPKYEKRFLNSMIKMINYPHDQDTFFTRLKIRVLNASIMIISFVCWFYLFYYEYLSYYFGIEYDPSLVAKLVFDSIVVFIFPFMFGAIVTTIIVFFYSKHTVWRDLKQYVDRDKLLNRISQLECEISNHTRKKS